MKKKTILHSCLAFLTLVSVSQPLFAKEACDFFYKKDAGGISKLEWPLIGKNHGNTRATLKEDKINSKNVSNLLPKWTNISENSVAVTSQPTVANGIAYFADLNGNVYAINCETGNTLWQITLPEQTFSTSPILTDKDLFIGNNKMFAIERETGKVRWSKTLSEPNELYIKASTPTFIDGLLIFGIGLDDKADLDSQNHFKGRIVALKASTGKVAWKFYTSVTNDGAGNGVAVNSTPAVDKDSGLIFFGTEHNFTTNTSPYSDALLAIHYKTGKIAWSYQFSNNDIHNASMTNRQPGTYSLGISAHPNLFCATLENGIKEEYVGVGDKNGHYKIFTRKQRKDSCIKPIVDLQIDQPASNFGGILATAAVSNGILYIASTAYLDDQQQRLSMDYALKSNDLSELLNRSSVKIMALSIPNLVKNPTPNGIIPRDAILWQTFSDGAINSNHLSIANGILYQTSLTGYLRAIDTLNGKEVWRTYPSIFNNTPSPISSGVTIVNGHIFLGIGTELSPLKPGGAICFTLPKI